MNLTSSKKFSHVRSERGLSHRSTLTTAQKSRSPLTKCRTISNITHLKNKSDNISSTFGEITIDTSTKLYKQAKALYISKCKDLMITPTAEQELRFFTILKSNASMRKLDLKEQKLSSESSSVLSKILKNNTQFAYINLSKNYLSNKGSILIVKSLLTCSNLVSLDLSSNDISQAASEEILALLSKHPSICSLNISSHHITLKNKIGSCEALLRVIRCPTLTHLNVSGTSIGNEGLKYLIIGLENNDHIVYLNISNNNIKGHILKELFQVIVRSKVFEINLSNNPIEEAGAEELAYYFTGFYGFRIISKISIDGATIPFTAACKVFEALIRENTLEYLSLENNNFCGYLEVLERLVSENSKLKYLNLSNCLLQNEIFCRIFQGLCYNSSLECLVISGNYCKDSGAESISKALTKNKVLKSLDVSFNQIKSSGGIEIANALQTNQTLNSLFLCENELNDDAGNYFVSVFVNNTTLTRLQLQLNPMSNKYILDIQRLLKRNRRILQKKTAKRIKEAITCREIPVAYSDNHYKERILENKIEKIHLENKIGSSLRLLQTIKEEEANRLEGLKLKSSELKKKNIELSKILSNFTTNIRLQSQLQERTYKDFDQKNRKIEIEILTSEQKKKSIIAKYESNKHKYHRDYQRLLKELEILNNDKNFTMKILYSIKNKIAESRLINLTNPSTLRTSSQPKSIKKKSSSLKSKSKSPIPLKK